MCSLNVLTSACVQCFHISAAYGLKSVWPNQTGTTMDWGFASNGGPVWFTTLVASDDPPLSVSLARPSVCVPNFQRYQMLGTLGAAHGPGTSTADWLREATNCEGTRDFLLRRWWALPSSVERQRRKSFIASVQDTGRKEVKVNTCEIRHWFSLTQEDPCLLHTVVPERTVCLLWEFRLWLCN